MRKDMFKVMTERSRKGGDYNRKGRSLKSEDDLPKKESMKKKYNDRKEQGENYAPLIRFFKSKVGSDWDLAYSEFCQVFSSSNEVQRRIRKYVNDFVKRNVVVKGKNVYYSSPYSGRLIELWNEDVYVDPESNKIKIYKVKKKFRKSYNGFEFEEEIQHLVSSKKSKLVIDGKNVYKLFFDKLTDDFTTKYEATGLHAEHDFKNAKGPFNDCVGSLNNIIKKYSSRLNLKHPYFKKYIELLNKSQIEKTERKKFDFKAGDEILFKNHRETDWTVGIINTVHPSSTSSSYSVSITVGTKNISLLSGFGTIRKK